MVGLTYCKAHTLFDFVTVRLILIEPRYVKTVFFAYAKTKTQISCTVSFATWIIQSLYFLNTKFQATNHILWLYSPVCVGPGNTEDRFSCVVAHILT